MHDGAGTKQVLMQVGMQRLRSGSILFDYWPMRPFFCWASHLGIDFGCPSIKIYSTWSLDGTRIWDQTCLIWWKFHSQDLCHRLSIAIPSEWVRSHHWVCLKMSLKKTACQKTGWQPLTFARVPIWVSLNGHAHLCSWNLWRTRVLKVGRTLD